MKHPEFIYMPTSLEDTKQAIDDFAKVQISGVNLTDIDEIKE